MSSKRIFWALCVVLAGSFAVGRGQAQQAGAPAGETAAKNANDPRVGLKAGRDDAAVASKNIELVGHLPRPEGFVDPTGAGSLDYANSDLAFQREQLFLGNFHGFNFYNVEDPKKPKLRVSIVCPGGQGDLSIYKNLLFMSVEQANGRIDCGSQGNVDEKGAQLTSAPTRFRGVRIFDVTNMDAPKQIAAVQTCRGSHTHTLVIDPNDNANIYIYGSGTGGVRPGDELAGCTAEASDPNVATFSIDVIQVPLAAPQNAKVVNRPRIFADPATGANAGLNPGTARGAQPPAGSQPQSETNRCHDITTYPALGLAAGACAGNGILLDIHDPVHPIRLDAVADPDFAFWHSATFNNDGTKVIFTDEWGGGTNPRCRASDLLKWGADAIFDIVDRKLVFKGYYKMPAPQTDVENCVAHNGSLIPVPGRDIMVQAWYQGGLSMFDFTDSAHPVEIAYFDRGPIDGTKLVVAGYWSTYWYNGVIYGSEIGRGLDLFKLKPSDMLSKNELDAAMLVKFNELNVQHQPRMNWPASFVVAKAYLDQLTRSKVMKTARANVLMSQMDKVEKMSAGAARVAAAKQLSDSTKQLDDESLAAKGMDAKRLQMLAATIRLRAAELK